jgi:hypothetical protein
MGAKYATSETLSNGVMDDMPGENSLENTFLIFGRVIVVKEKSNNLCDEFRIFGNILFTNESPAAI